MRGAATEEGELNGASYSLSSYAAARVRFQHLSRQRAGAVEPDLSDDESNGETPIDETVWAEEETTLMHTVHSATKQLERSIRVAGLRRVRESSLIDECRALEDLNGRLVSMVRETSRENIARVQEESGRHRRVAAEAAEKKISEAAEAVASAKRENAEELCMEREAKARVQEEYNRAIEALQADQAEWKAAQLARMRDEYNRQTERLKDQARMLAEKRIQVSDANWTTRLDDARRGADVRVAIAEEKMEALRGDVESVVTARLEEASKGEARLKARVAELEANMDNAVRVHAEAIARERDHAKQLEDRLRDVTAERDGAKQEAKHGTELAATRRQMELVALDEKIRRTLHAKQSTIDRLRSERDFQLKRADEAQNLLYQIEHGLSAES